MNPPTLQNTKTMLGERAGEVFPTLSDFKRKGERTAAYISKNVNNYSEILGFAQMWSVWNILKFTKVFM